MSLTEDITTLAQAAKTASRQMSRMDTEEKNLCLNSMADILESEKASIKEENNKDMELAQKSGLGQAMTDRLLLNEGRILAMAQGLREVAGLPDPVGKILTKMKRPSGLKLRKVSCPIGVVVIIYESRPNVTADAAGLCFKSGNSTILRGGKESLNSNKIIAKYMLKACQSVFPKFPKGAIQVVPTANREAIPELLSLTKLIDLCIPRGGEGLIKAVTECSKVPVIKHYKGICSVYVDREANLDKAISVVVNSKTHRTGVCNAMETLLIDSVIAPDLLPIIGKALAKKGVELRGCNKSRAILGDDLTIPANDTDWDTEYLDLICSIRTVDGIEGALEHINTHGSGHTDCIVTENKSIADRFQNGVDASAVFWNVSTRFSDGGEFGMGAEIGISTDKIGARGPMGLAELTTYKWLGEGDGLARA